MREGDLYIAERDNHVIRKVDMKTGMISTVAGTGAKGFSGDGGPGAKAQLNQPHSILFDRDGTLLICDIGNQRIRRLHLDTGIIETYAGTGEAAATPEGAPVHGTPLKGPRTLAMARNGDLYLALREGNAILRIDAKTQTLHRVAGTGKAGYTGDGGPALDATLGGPKGWLTTEATIFTWRNRESRHPAHKSEDGNYFDGARGRACAATARMSNPLNCKLSRPHGVSVRERRTVRDQQRSASDTGAALGDCIIWTASL